MAVVPRAYGLFLKSALSKEVAWLTDTVKVALCTNAYTPDQDTHQYFSQVTNEVTGTGYTAGGATVTGKDLTYDAPTNTLTVTCSAVTWTDVTITGIRYAIFYVATGTAATSPLICYINLGVDANPSGTDYTVSLPAAGLATLTVG